MPNANCYMLGEIESKGAKGEQATIDRWYNKQRYASRKKKAQVRRTTLLRINLYSNSTIKLILCQLRFRTPLHINYAAV